MGWQFANPNSFGAGHDGGFLIGTGSHLPKVGAEILRPESLPFINAVMIIGIPRGLSSPAALSAYARLGAGPPSPRREASDSLFTSAAIQVFAGSRTQGAFRSQIREASVTVLSIRSGPRGA